MQPSLWPVDGGPLDLLDKRISGPLFRLRLPLPVEATLSVPGCWFGMPAALSVLPPLLALLDMGCCQATPPLSLAALGLAGCALLAAWGYMQSAPSHAQHIAWMHGTPAHVISPLLGAGLTELIAPDDSHARSAAYLFLLLWYISMVPVITLKAATRRRRPLASDPAHIGVEAASATHLKALANIPHMHRLGDPNSAFPSGDVAGAVAFAYPLLRCAGPRGDDEAMALVPAVVACACMILSALGRLYYQAHGLLDVTCGAIVGTGCGLLLEYALNGGLHGDACSAGVAPWEPFVALACLGAYSKLTKMGKTVASARDAEVCPPSSPLKALWRPHRGHSVGR